VVLFRPPLPPPVLAVPFPDGVLLVPAVPPPAPPEPPVPTPPKEPPPPPA
jgi:hypothetical protein